MANSKDFAVKGLVETGDAVVETLGTATNGTIDLSTGNYFKVTSTEDMSFSFINPAETQTFQVELTGGRKPFELLAWNLIDESRDFASSLGSSYGFFLKPDGRVLYMTSLGADVIAQTSESAAEDAFYLGAFSTSIAAADKVSHTNPMGIAFKPDGTEFYVGISNSATLTQYTLTTAWDIRTATSGDTFTLSASTCRALQFKSDGSVFFQLDGNNTLRKYTMTTAWDITTASADGTFSYDSDIATYNPGAGITGAFVSTDGAIMVAYDSDPRGIRYNLSTAFDLSTATLDYYCEGSLHNSNDPFGLYFNDAGTEITFIYDSELWRFEVFGDCEVTYPSTVQWQGGSAPEVTKADQVSLLTFTTADGGQTYNGYVSSTNLKAGLSDV